MTTATDEHGDTVNMRWYFAMDEAGGMSHSGIYARLAVLSAKAAGGLEPRLLYYGQPTAFTAWMQQNGVEVIPSRPSFLDSMQQAETENRFKPYSIGHWLRIAIPLIEQERDFALYTDCDVIFLRPVDWRQTRPERFAAAPEFKPDDWRYFNSGVMLLNIEAMRRTYPMFEAQIRAKIGHQPHYDDQFALNEFYAGQWTKLNPLLNWKPYWPYNARAPILHFHGPKLDSIEAITDGRWPRLDDTMAMLGKMLDENIASYIDWCNHLGDALQNAAPEFSLRFQNIASALIRHRRTLPESTT